MDSKNGKVKFLSRKKVLKCHFAIGILPNGTLIEYLKPVDLEGNVLVHKRIQYALDFWQSRYLLPGMEGLN